jgi:hypothetical protein
MRFPKLLLSLVTAAALLAPITADAKTSLLRDVGNRFYKYKIILRL